MSTLILASNSPRRKELLALIGIPFVTLPVEVDESPLPDEDPAGCVVRLARSKAQAALDRSSYQTPGDLILASDTIVTYDRQILGKPASPADARRMLMDLRGHTHTVLTAISLARVGSRVVSTSVCDTAVPMRKYSDIEMDAYVATGDPMDKAGSYAIQHAGFHPVENMTGCYASVMGLPLCHVTRLLTAMNEHILQDVPSACQSALKYPCTVYPSIFNAKPEIQEN